VIYLVVALATCASGVALLHLVRLEAGSVAVDIPLGWMVGAAWFALGAFAARSLAGIATGGWVSAAILALPVAGWAFSRFRTSAARKPREAAPAHEARRLPRPIWMFAPMVAWILVAAGGVTIHGASTPTHTDDAYRVRGLAPVLVARGDWTHEARAVVAMTGAIPAFLPALPWVAGAPVEPLHVGWASVLTFLALLGVVIGLGVARGAPEVGWGSAFALTTMPLLLYHWTSTYSDGWLAAYLGAAFAFLVAYGRWGQEGDAGRALLLLLGVAMVKREGELLALPVIVILLAQVAWRGRRDGLRAVTRLLGLCIAWPVMLAARVATVGVEGAFPFLRAAADRATGPAAATDAAVSLARGQSSPGAGAIFLDAVFSDGNLGILYWVLVASLVLLFPRIRRNGLSWSAVALAVLLAETAASAIWLYPQFTLDHSTVHRSLLPVSAAAAVWLAALLVEGPTVPAAPPQAEPRSARRARRRAAARA
jgi:hypothetical protein